LDAYNKLSWFSNKMPVMGAVMTQCNNNIFQYKYKFLRKLHTSYPYLADGSTQTL
jgi:hypothetical protein